MLRLSTSYFCCHLSRESQSHSLVILFSGAAHMDRTGSAASSSIRRRSLSISSRLSHQNDNNDADADCVSEAGDIGDKALPSRRFSDIGSFRLSFDFRSENGVVPSIPEDLKTQTYPAFMHSNSSVTPAPPELPSSVSANAILASDEDAKQEPEKGLPKLLDYASCLVHLAVFGILGVLSRYLLQKLFGPEVADVTSDQTILYLDLPSNMYGVWLVAVFLREQENHYSSGYTKHGDLAMIYLCLGMLLGQAGVGSFLMGWFGVVFKGDISHVYEHLAIAITTGYLGSLTTFSGWNQKMLELSVKGHWLFAVLGFFIGLYLVAFSIIFGVETAKGLKWLLKRIKRSSGSSSSTVHWKVDSYNRQLIAMTVWLVILVLLWGVSSALVKAKFKHGGSAAQLWFACMVGPLGVWIRWFLARLNGRGLGRAGLFKWIPFGTLIANVSAACIMAALASLKEAVNTRNCETIVAGIQFGLMGCLSTVSTFAAEFNAMRESKHTWRAYAYAMVTICVSFALGILIYYLPVWTRGYDSEQY